MDNKGRWVAVWIGLFLVISTVVGLLIKSIIDNALYNRFPDRGVPRINIDLNGVSLDEIKSGSKETKYEGNDLQIYNGGEILEYGEVEVKGRGNGTWTQEKKPFQIKFENKVDMFGMGEARKWYLLANALDGTNLRTLAAFYIEEMLGMKYIYYGQFVELYVDGDYEGLYYLTHAVEVGKNTVDLRNPMGIIMEIDNIYGDSEDNYVTRNGNLMVIKDLVNEENREVAVLDFLNNYDKLERAIYDNDYKKVKELADIESLAQYYLISEFSVNPDAYWTSFYFYKDGIGDKIHAGPMWDFDLAFSNRRWGNWLGERLYSSTEKMARKNEILPKEIYEIEGLNIDDYVSSLKIATLVYDLMEMSEFQDEVKEVFNKKMSGRGDEFVNKLKVKQNEIYNSAVVNEEKWIEESENMKKNLKSVFGDRITEGHEFEMEFDVMLNWIRQRYDYFEQEYGEGLQKNILYI